MNTALIGVGGYGAQHLRTIARLEGQNRLRLRLVAVADPSGGLDADRAKLGELGVRWYADYRHLLDHEEKLDLIVISSPIPWHERMTREVLANTNARILLEKPAVPTLEQLRNLIGRDTARKVRVGFQMIHWPQVQKMKSLLEGTQIERVLVSAGLPRDVRYYQRNDWAGRMQLDGEPVFDGVATNAAAHLVHLALYLAGPKPENFAMPDLVEGELYRANSIESYDFAWLRALAGTGTEIQVALAHCVAQNVPFAIRVESSRGVLSLDDNGKRLSGFAFSAGPIHFEDQGNIDFYETLLWEEREYALSPTSLGDTMGYSLLTCGGLLSSGGIHAIPANFISPHGGVLEAKGLREFLRSFPKEPCPPSQRFSWGRPGRTMPAKSIATQGLRIAGGRL